jgi:hypothetical protein
MRLRWGQGDYEPVERYISCEGLPDRARAWLMPGGNSILCASYKGDLTLHRISPGPHPSVEPVPFVSYSVGAAQAYHDWMALLRTTSPYPIFAYASGSRYTPRYIFCKNSFTHVPIGFTSFLLTTGMGEYFQNKLFRPL